MSVITLRGGFTQIKNSRDVPQDRELIDLRYSMLDGRWILLSPGYRAVGLTPETQLASRHEAGNDQHVHFEQKGLGGAFEPVVR